RRQPPRRRVAIRLAGRSLARAKPRHAEPRMIREQRDELLSDLSGRAENAHIHHHVAFPSVSFVPLCALYARKKKADAVVCRVGLESLAVFLLIYLLLAHTESDSTGPLGAEALSRVGDGVHEAGSIAWRSDASSALPRLGAAARRRGEGPRRAAVRLGARLDSDQRPPAGRGAGRNGRRLGVARDERHRRVLHAAAYD